MHQVAKTILFVDLKLYLEGLATERRCCRIIGTLQQRRRITSISASFPTNKGPESDFQTSWDSESKLFWGNYKSNLALILSFQISDSRDFLGWCWLLVMKKRFERQRYLLLQWINVGAQPRSPDCELSHCDCKTDLIVMIQMMTAKNIFVFIGILEIAVRLRRWPHPLISFKQSSRRRPMIQPARGKLAKSI